MDNTWYYTLSTIAQTLAAILGLAVVFVTIRMQKITEKLSEYKMRADLIIKKKYKHVEKNAEKIPERTASGLYDELKEIIKNYSDKYERDSGFYADILHLSATFEPYLSFDNLTYIKDTKHNLLIYINQRKNLSQVVKLPGIITSGTVIYSILLLSLSNLFQYNICVANFFLFFASIFSIISIFLVVTASWKLLKDTGEKT